MLSSDCIRISSHAQNVGCTYDTDCFCGDEIVHSCSAGKCFCIGRLFLRNEYYKIL